MEESILNTIKKMLGISDGDLSFDTDIFVYINSTFMILNQLGIGPAEGYSISSDKETWKEYLHDSLKFESVKNFMFIKVKLVFDPPSTSFVIEAMNNTVKELEWRLVVQAESVIPAVVV